jgi:hypothetical protein
MPISYRQILLIALLSLFALEIAAEVTTDDKEPLIIRVSSIMTVYFILTMFQRWC